MAFHRAMAVHDGTSACRLLAPSTGQETGQNAKTSCAKAVTDEDVPAGGAVKQVQVWGLAAEVVMDGDVVFLTTTDGHWTVTAAGCQAQPGQPYRCSVKGG